MNGLASLKYIQLEKNVAPTQSAAIERIEEILNEGLEKSFPVYVPDVRNVRPPGELYCIREGLREMHAVDISCIVEFEQFIIELNAERRNSEWFSMFQIFKNGIVIIPWIAPALPPSRTKKNAIEVAAKRAIADIRRGLAEAFR